MTNLKLRLRRHILVPLFTILFAGGLVSMSGCDMLGLSDFVGGSDDSGTARMQVLLVDNPFPFDLVSEVNVTISHVELRNDETKITISDEPRTFQLLELQNGVSAELGDIELPAGTYHEAGLTVDDANIVLNDGQVFDLKVPSGRIKVLLNDVTVESGQDVSLTLDFDVSKSFVVQGNPNTPAGIKGFIMKPTVISKGMKDNGRGDDDGDRDEDEEEENGAGDDDAEEGDDDAEEGDDDAEEGDDDAEEGDDDAEEGGDDAEEGDDDAEEGGDDAEEGGDDAEEGGDDAEEGGDDAEEGDENADEGDENAEEGDDNAEEGGDDAEEGDDNAEEGGDDAEEGDDNAEEGGDDAEEGGEEEDEGGN